MNRITKTLQQLKTDAKKALVTYIVNGDPTPGVTLPALHALVEGGADILEIGVPFSDPMADGPVIQRGHERALDHNVSLRDTFKLVADFRQQDKDTPIVLMGYANPVERMGYDTFAELACDAGVDGLITVDLPPEEAPTLTEKLRDKNLDSIFLLAPTSTGERIDKVLKLASGFVYYVSLNGVTGAGIVDSSEVKERVSLIKSRTSIPVLVGFGIKDAQSAKNIGATADGVVIGSVLVKAMGDVQDGSVEKICDVLKEKVSDVRAGLDALS